MVECGCLYLSKCPELKYYGHQILNLIASKNLHVNNSNFIFGEEMNDGAIFYLACIKYATY